MTRKAQRPIDVKDMPWSHIGKDALRVLRDIRDDANRER